jgi:phage terminase large subunit-like protein
VRAAILIRCFRKEGSIRTWQIFLLTTIFGWVKADGSRRFRSVYVEVPRGNGKSGLTSGVALYMLCADGEGGAEVYSFATTHDQAKIVFGDAQNMVRLTPWFSKVFCFAPLIGCKGI